MATLPSIFDDLYRPFDDLFSSPVTPRAVPRMPAVDITRDAHMLHLEFDVPGYNAEQIFVEAHDHVLTVRGEHHKEAQHGEGEVLHRERHRGTFLRRFSLPKGADDSAIKADVKDGVLSIRVPYEDVTAPRRITVE